MPEDHRKYLEWDGDRFRRWADQIGPFTRKTIDAILTTGQIEQQYYRSCMGLLKIADKHSSQTLERACEKALGYTSRPSYKTIKNVIASMEKQSSDKAAVPDKQPRGITRGARYYGGIEHD